MCKRLSAVPSQNLNVHTILFQKPTTLTEFQLIVIMRPSTTMLQSACNMNPCFDLLADLPVDLQRLRARR